MTTIRVNGWVERVADDTGVRILHLTDNRSKRVCRCAYDMGEKKGSKRTPTYNVDSQVLARDGEGGKLYIERVDTMLHPDVVLCDKSQVELNKDLAKLQEFEHASSRE